MHWVLQHRISKQHFIHKYHLCATYIKFLLWIYVEACSRGLIYIHWLMSEPNGMGASLHTGLHRDVLCPHSMVLFLLSLGVAHFRLVSQIYSESSPLFCITWNAALPCTMENEESLSKWMLQMLNIDTDQKTTEEGRLPPCSNVHHCKLALACKHALRWAGVIIWIT